MFVADSRNNVHRVFYGFSNLGEELNLALLIEKKNKCMTMSPYLLRRKLIMNSEPVDQVMEVKYLGVSCSKSDRDVYKRQVKWLLIVLQVFDYSFTTGGF